MKKRNGWQWLLLIAALALLTWCLWAVDAVGSHLQYMVEPSGDVAEAAADLAALAEEWENTQRAWTLGGFIQQASMKAEGQSAQGRVTLLGQDGLTLQPLELLHGRLFTPDELNGREPLALLDEQLAFALFRETDATGRTFTLGGMTFRVVGVVRHTRQVGDSMDFGAYVPLLCGLTPDALLVQADPLPGVGADASFSGVCSLWRSDGAFIDLHKEAVGATMWARVLAFCLGAAGLLALVRWLNSRVHAAVAWHRRALQQSYALQLLPRTAGLALALILGYAAAAGIAFLLLDFIIQPVYVYPERVPAVLVEWEEIQATFWQVQQSRADFHALRTPELLHLQFLAGLIRAACAVTAVLLCRLLPARPRPQ